MSHPSDVDIRPVVESEMPDWGRAFNTAFLLEPTSPDEVVRARGHLFVPGRLLGAFDGDRCVATFRSFDQEVTAVGGALVPANALSAVAVAPTHRRRGLLSRMMARDLAAARERGDVLATLIAAEYPIYGRYGFGPATTTTEWTVDVPRAGLDPRWAGPDDGGRLDLVGGAEVLELGPELFERLRRSRPGAVGKPPHWWRSQTGDLRFEADWKEPFFVVYRSARGVVEGMAAYTADDRWGDAKQPQNTLSVRWLIGVTPVAEEALWRFLCSVDWVTTVKSGWRAPDDLLPQFLPDPRAAHVTTHADWLWLRLLDVPRALEARTYESPGALVLDVVDPAGLAGGRWRLEAAESGEASCVATTESADLVLDVRSLATLWLGDESTARLAALGRVEEERPGALRTADRMLRTARRPWCPDMF
ncbi:GNAT family N-acetyltransferase [Streptomyces sp. ZYX-F-203]